MPLHVLLYRAFGWEAPEFAHLPLIMKPVGNGKLSNVTVTNGISCISIGLENRRAFHQVTIFPKL
jgi:glutamyl/glutaminyl-tRNA synthetase